MKQVLENKYTLLYKGMGERQRGKCFSASFNAKCLVVSKKMTILNTHTHTHTHTHTMFAPIVV